MEQPNPDLQLATIFESDDAVAFSIAKATLEDADIEFATSEDALTGYGFSPMLNPVWRIQVAEPFKDRALELMQGLSEPDEHGESAAADERGEGADGE